jgi:predicted SprT family Zn-dependent metalloprotease
MFATQKEIDLYVRMTLKQFDFGHLKIRWSKNAKTFLGLADVCHNVLVLNPRILCSFRVFEEVLKHEIAHFIQYKNNGNKFLTKNGRRSYHGKDFAAACRIVGVPARTRIPIPFYV